MNERTMEEQSGLDRPKASESCTAPRTSEREISRRLADGHFALRRPPQELPFTGERMTTEMEGQIAFEHLHRYCVARDICVNKDVLDVASGEGYGSALLAGVARHVVGVEIDPVSVSHARAAYAATNLEFIEGDAHALPVDDASFDVVVSFETLEHLRDQEQFLREVRRVLRPEGVLLVSTPDRHVYSARGQPVNRFHVLELSQPEFATLLSNFFIHYRILRQRTLLGSVMASPEAGGEWRSYDRRAADVLEAMSGLSRAFYLIGVAGDGPLPAVGESIYADNQSVDDLIAAARALPQLREESALALASEQEKLRLVRSDLESALASLREEIRQARLKEAELSRQAAELSRQVEAFQISTWWRISGSLRAVAQRFPRLACQSRRVLKLGYWVLTGQLLQRLRQRRTNAMPINPWPLKSVDLRSQLGLPPPINPVPPASQIAVASQGSPPVVSIIIPTFGKVEYTLRCLASIAAAPPRVPIEVIVVDDASGDPEVSQLRSVSGIRLIVHRTNLGFLRCCNDAARLAQGNLLMLLNNDTEVMPGAIDALSELLMTRPDAGMVGARLLYPDGLQQEAGGIVWRDGSAWNYGHRDDPRKPEYNYVRETDYVSGAAIMLPRAIWHRLNGFDEHFAPAYCEDSDLAFRVRAAGLKVLYQPEAKIIHFEGISHGTDTSSGVKANQLANVVKLAERWRATLRRSHFPIGKRVMRARDRSVDRTVTLVIDHYVPEPDRDAGSRTMIAFMEALLATGRIVKFFPANGNPSPGYTSALQRRGIEVMYGPWSGTLADWIAANGAEIDEILLSRPSIAEKWLHVLEVHCRAPIVFYGHDLHYARLRRESVARGDPEKLKAADANETLERRVWRAVDVVLYPSEEEVAVVRALEPTVVARSIPAYVFPSAPPVRNSPPSSANLIFVAGFAHPPNTDAAIWFVQEILPRIRAMCSDVTLAIVGSNPTQAVRDLAEEGIEVTGFVPDEELTRRYANARVAVCPLRYGAGVKLKVVEAMHHGVPLVTTPTGGQGLEGLNTVCEVHAEPVDFASAVVRLLEDDTFWMTRAGAQAKYVAGRFSCEKIRDVLVEAFDTASVARRIDLPLPTSLPMINQATRVSSFIPPSA
jgi:O-antigen biosynthesis protein